jgi:hypothetical protein
MAIDSLGKGGIPEGRQVGRFYINNHDEDYPSFATVEEAIEASKRLGGEVLVNGSQIELSDEERSKLEKAGL